MSQMPRKTAASNMSCESPIAAAIAIASREKSDSSMPTCPCVTPSHIAGTPPATCAVAAGGARRRADDLGEALIGLMRREHVVIGGDDREVGRRLAADRRLVVGRAGGEAMGEVGAGEPRRDAAPCAPRARMRSRYCARLARAAPADTLGDFSDARVKRHGSLLFASRPGRSAGYRPMRHASAMPGGGPTNSGRMTCNLSCAARALPHGVGRLRRLAGDLRG